MDRWLHHRSHPIVFVDFDARLGLLCFSQTPKMPSRQHQRWPVPIWIECLEGTVPEALFWIPDDQGDVIIFLVSLQGFLCFTTYFFGNDVMMNFVASWREFLCFPTNFFAHRHGGIKCAKTLVFKKQNSMFYLNYCIFNFFGSYLGYLGTQNHGFYPL